MLRTIRFALAFPLLLLTGCGAAMDKSLAASPGMAPRETAAPSADRTPTAGSDLAPPPPPPSGTEPTASTNAKTGVAEATKPGPLLIYEANVALAVYEVDKGLDAVERIAKGSGGYLVSRDGSTIVVRVPAAGFDANLSQILALGEVLRRELHAEDVTGKVRDLEARLKNAEAVRQRLTELLSSAAKTDDALAVERELARVTDELERMKAELKRFRELVAYSTVTVRFEAPHAEALDRRFTLPFPWLEELGLSRLLKL